GEALAGACGGGECPLVVRGVSPGAACDDVALVGVERWHLNPSELEAALEVESALGICDQRGGAHYVGPTPAAVVLAVDEHGIAPHANVHTGSTERSGGESSSML